MSHTPVFSFLFFAVALNAQPIQFQSIVHQGSVLAGYTFPPDTIISAASLNDAGEAAFAIRSSVGAPEREAVFTSHRLVARQGDVLGGKILMKIPADTTIAINNAGQVAFEAWYADNAEVARAGAFSGLGVFVDNRLAATTALDPSGKPPAFTLGDDGQVVIGSSPSKEPVPSTTPSPKHPSLFSHVHLKAPQGLPISIGEGTPKPPLPGQAQSIAAHPAASPFPTNHRGQILIPVNLPDGFLLLLGTPSIQ